MFCPKCGKELPDDAKFCPVCGYSLNGDQVVNNEKAKDDAPVSDKSRLVALLLCIFLGGIGVHEFYVGKIGAGIAMLLLSWTGVPSIIAFVHIFMIALGTFKDSDGLLVTNWEA